MAKYFTRAVHRTAAKNKLQKTISLYRESYDGILLNDQRALDNLIQKLEEVVIKTNEVYSKCAGVEIKIFRCNEEVTVGVGEIFYVYIHKVKQNSCEKCALEICEKQRTIIKGEVMKFANKENAFDVAMTIDNAGYPVVN